MFTQQKATHLPASVWLNLMVSLFILTNVTRGFLPTGILYWICIHTDKKINNLSHPGPTSKRSSEHLVPLVKPVHIRSRKPMGEHCYASLDKSTLNHLSHPKHTQDLQQRPADQSGFLLFGWEENGFDHSTSQQLFFKDGFCIFPLFYVLSVAFAVVFTVGFIEVYGVFFV